jgi:hypothetical protein
MSTWRSTTYRRWKSGALPSFEPAPPDAPELLSFVRLLHTHIDLLHQRPVLLTHDGPVLALVDLVDAGQDSAGRTELAVRMRWCEDATAPLDTACGAVFAVLQGDAIDGGLFGNARADVAEDNIEDYLEPGLGFLDWLHGRPGQPISPRALGGDVQIDWMWLCLTLRTVLLLHGDRWQPRVVMGSTGALDVPAWEAKGFLVLARDGGLVPGADGTLTPLASDLLRPPRRTLAELGTILGGRDGDPLALLRARAAGDAALVAAVRSSDSGVELSLPRLVTSLAHHPPVLRDVASGWAWQEAADMLRGWDQRATGWGVGGPEALSAELPDEQPARVLLGGADLTTVADLLGRMSSPSSSLRCAAARLLPDALSAAEVLPSEPAEWTDHHLSEQYRVNADDFLQRWRGTGSEPDRGEVARRVLTQLTPAGWEASSPPLDLLAHAGAGPWTTRPELEYVLDVLACWPRGRALPTARLAQATGYFWLTHAPWLFEVIPADRHGHWVDLMLPWTQRYPDHSGVPAVWRAASETQRDAMHSAVLATHIREPDFQARSVAAWIDNTHSDWARWLPVPTTETLATVVRRGCAAPLRWPTPQDAPIVAFWRYVGCRIHAMDSWTPDEHAQGVARALTVNAATSLLAWPDPSGLLPLLLDLWYLGPEGVLERTAPPPPHRLALLQRAVTTMRAPHPQMEQPPSWGHLRKRALQWQVALRWVELARDPVQALDELYRADGDARKVIYELGWDLLAQRQPDWAAAAWSAVLELRWPPGGILSSVPPHLHSALVLASQGALADRYLEQSPPDAQEATILFAYTWDGEELQPAQVLRYTTVETHRFLLATAAGRPPQPPAGAPLSTSVLHAWLDSLATPWLHTRGHTTEPHSAPGTVLKKLWPGCWVACLGCDALPPELASLVRPSNHEAALRKLRRRATGRQAPTVSHAPTAVEPRAPMAPAAAARRESDPAQAGHPPGEAMPTTIPRWFQVLPAVVLVVAGLALWRGCPGEEPLQVPEPVDVYELGPITGPPEDVTFPLPMSWQPDVAPDDDEAAPPADGEPEPTGTAP